MHPEIMPQGQEKLQDICFDQAKSTATDAEGNRR